MDETPGLVRPITLNVIGHVLDASKTVAPSPEAGQLVHRYIAQTIEQPAIRDLAPPVLEQLITEQATKRQRSEQELGTATHLRPAEIRAVLNGLGAAALVRPLDPAHAVWELSHDFIARAASRYLGRRRRDLIRRFAAYASPALLVMALLGIAGTVAFERLTPYQVRAELAELGLTVALASGGMAVERNSHLTPESFAKTGPLLQRLDNITALDLSLTEVANLDPLNGLSSLQSLNISGTRVADLDPLEGLSSLQSLDLSDTMVVNLDPLNGLSSLQSLNLYGTQVANLDPLKGLSSLQSLNLYGDAGGQPRPAQGPEQPAGPHSLGQPMVANLDPLKGLSSLQSSSTSMDTPVAYLDPLKGLSGLQEPQPLWNAGRRPRSA